MLSNPNPDIKRCLELIEMVAQEDWDQLPEFERTLIGLGRQVK